MRKVKIQAPRSFDELKKIAAQLTYELGRSEKAAENAREAQYSALTAFDNADDEEKRTEALFNLGNAKYQETVHGKDVASYTRLLEDVNKKAAKLIAKEPK